MRYILILLLTALTLFPVHTSAAPNNEKTDNMASIIIEVEGNPHEHKQYINNHYPYVEIVAVYDTLFNGLALKASPRRLSRMDSLDFVKAVHPTAVFETNLSNETARTERMPENENAFIPGSINNTDYTGDGVQVAVIDTGIAYDHPDLAGNYVTGFDLVDLDDDPMETLKSQGIPTMHGTHVAGIIAADGELTGVAPDADIYAYRALGPGGRGTSVQVIAALEQAVNDGADVINLSLGNTVNGPDFPTSVAVNRAVEKGVTVVIANGNSGPDTWTVGSPATAAKAISVGAAANPQKVPYLYETLLDKKISIALMAGSVPWDFTTDHQIAPFPEKNVRGKIALIKRGKVPFHELAEQAEEAGAIAVLIYNNEKGTFQGSIDNGEDPIGIPVASISKRDGEWLLQHAKKKHFYMETNYATTKLNIAPFSSRGPVTVNWDLKPDVSAPGTNILSTVPGGYMELQGTSMAAPHVTGTVALIKEAHPKWTTAQISGALKTTAQRIKHHGKPISPIVQGMGEIQPKAAINTTSILYNPLLSYGKITSYKQSKTIHLKIENTSSHGQQYTFNIPKKQQGITWQLPLSFTIPKGETRTVPVELSINSSLLGKGIHQGWLTLKQGEKAYQLPYMFINQTAEYPKAMGFSFSLKPFSAKEYVYQIYVTEPAERIEVNLYNPDTLLFDRTLLKLKDVDAGMVKGHFEKNKLGKPGKYRAVITVHLKNGEIESHQTEVTIPGTAPGSS
ncbi:S8 family serine peptidase [Virgibacillus siamensis]|uniref:S8 family serine peptidase n=1 Tax=Virgibacillus siamensis TaxID=480071 RepID=UPI000986B6EF|nr:S8 family serine peptidase [Virgibacillus siamensis]